MALTPATNTASYLPAANFLNFYDARTIGDLVSDTGTRVPSASLASNVVLIQLLAAASGMVEGACLKGQRYQAADLASIASLTNPTNGSPAQGLLWQIIADLTMGLIIRRRPDKKIPIPPAFDAAMDWLEQLASGEKIFGFLETEQAGLPNIYQEVSMDVDRRDLIDVQGRRFFGRRVNQDRSFPW